jgi:hypothetical protein
MDRLGHPVCIAIQAGLRDDRLQQMVGGRIHIHAGEVDLPGERAVFR